ncbi:glycolipid 2-alpha-mannosyltransferase-domain-containing protein [Mucidula mucida]|nr:glycolipid 2-alpha-mannosyltransferase-domain-containing protein [Mucidula mucida]
MYFPLIPARKRAGFIGAGLVITLYLTYVLSCYYYQNTSSRHESASIVSEGPGHLDSTSSEASAGNVFNDVEPEIIPTAHLTPAVESAHINRPIGEGSANATMVMLCRNDEIENVLSSMSSVETRFNQRYGYPWVFLNEVEFTEEFKSRVSQATSAPVSFGLVPAEHWFQPHWIDELQATKSRQKMAAAKIIYASSVPYRNMCRFNSGFFFKHPLLQPYRYYWRVEPNVKILCDVRFDPFDYLRDNNKIYGFTISFLEWEKTIPTLWSTVKEFTKRYPQYVHDNNALNYLSDNGGKSYNLCHFWSNFEIADMEFWRGEAYSKFFEYLESKGGFYYERWGDAPVHSIAAALFAPKDQLHFFRDIGYRHDPFHTVPVMESVRDLTRYYCSVNYSLLADYQPQSCIRRFEKLFQ